MECKICRKVYHNQRALNAHMVIHKEGNRYKQRSKKIAVYNCLQCNKLCEPHYSKTNKYCSNSCQFLYQHNEFAKQIKEGTQKFNSTIFYKYIVERDGHKCSKCGIIDWNNEPLRLDIDHIDGNNKNHKGSNLRLLCPNCHRQTPTWGNKRR